MPGIFDSPAYPGRGKKGETQLLPHFGQFAS
jgi:hypothetical protein